MFKRIIKGAGIIFTMTMLNTFFGFLIRITLARRLTLADFGLFYAIIAFLGLVGLLKNLGINQAMIKYVPEFLIKKDFGKVKTSILFSLFFSITTSFIVGSLLYYFSNDISVIYFKDPNVAGVLRIFLIFFVVQLLVASINSIFNAFQRPFLLSYGGVFINLVFFLLIFFTNDIEINRVVWYYNGVYITVLLTNCILLLNIFNIFKYRASSILPVAKKLVPFGAAATASTIVSHTTVRVDTIFLTFFQNLETVGIYSALTPFRMIFKVAGSSISKIFFPLTSELFGQGRIDELNNTLNKIHKYLIFILMPLAVVFIAYAEFIIVVIFGTEFAEGANAARLIVLASILQPISIINVGTINGLGQPIKNTQIITIGGILNLLLNIILIPLWSYNGAALAILVNGLVVFAATNFVIYRLINYRFDFFILVKILFAGTIMYGALMFFGDLFYDLSIWLTIVEYIFASLLGLAIYLGLCITIRITDIDEINKITKILLKR